MPPSPTPPPSGPTRRRPGPAMPGGWVWLAVVVVAFFVLWMMGEVAGSSAVDYSTFLNLADEGKIAKVTFSSGDRLIAEVKDTADLPPDISKKLARGKFTTYLPQHLETQKLAEELRKNKVEIAQEATH